MSSLSHQCRRKLYGKRFFQAYPPSCADNAQSVVRLNVLRYSNKPIQNNHTSITTIKTKSTSDDFFSSNPFRWYSGQLDRYPIRTKCLTSGLLAASGDLLCQYLQYRRKLKEMKSRDILIRTSLPEKNNFNPDFLRISRFGVLGCVLVAPIVHFWYGTLMLRIPGSSKLVVFQRTLLDQFLFAPLFVPLFMINLMMLEGQPAVQVQDMLIEKVPSTLMINWILWIPAQVINFSLIPGKYQVLFSNFVGFLWNAILSWKTQSR